MYGGIYYAHSTIACMLCTGALKKPEDIKTGRNKMNVLHKDGKLMEVRLKVQMVNYYLTTY